MTAKKKSLVKASFNFYWHEGDLTLEQKRELYDLLCLAADKLVEKGILEYESENFEDAWPE